MKINFIGNQILWTLFVFVKIDCSFAQQSKIDSLEQCLAIGSLDTLSLAFLHNSSIDFFNRGDYENSRRSARQAIKISEILLNKPPNEFYKVKFIRTKISAFCYLGNCDHAQGHYSEAKEKFDTALQISINISDKQWVSKLYGNIGTACNLQGNYDEALSYYSSARDVFLELEDKRNLAVTYNNIGTIHMRSGKIADAFTNFINSLRIKEELGDKRGAAYSYNNIGSIYFKQGNFQDALNSFTFSLNIRKELGDRKGIASCLNNIGELYGHQKDYAKAHESHLAALKLRSELGDKSGMSESNTNIGNLYNAEGLYQEAQNYFLEGLKINQEVGDKNGIALTTLSIGNMYSLMGKFKEGVTWLSNGLKLATEINDLDLVKQGYDMLSDLYLKTENYKNAYDYYKLMTSIKDSINNEEGMNQINELKTKYESEKKDKEISSLNNATKLQALLFEKKQIEVGRQKLAIENGKTKIDLLSTIKEVQDLELSKRNSELENEREISARLGNERKLQQKVIEKQNTIKNGILAGVGSLSIIFLLSFFLYRNIKTKRELTLRQTITNTEMKSLRSQMNPHFIFNSLNSIDDYIQNNDIENSSLYINKFSRLIRVILESSRVEEVFLKDDLETLELYIQLENLRMKNKVDYSFETSPEINQEQLLLPPMLLQPFVENAFKHAYEGIEKPKLVVKIYLKDGMLDCSVIDNGSGRLTKQEIAFDGKVKNESLGLRVTQERLDIINKIKKTKAILAFTDLTDDENKPTGTKVELVVPVSYAF